MSTNPRFIYDIETVALSDARLALVEPEHSAPGNFKDPVKIAEAIAEKSKAWHEKAALSPLTGRVAMIGTKAGAEPAILHLAFKGASDDDLDDQEALMLKAFWLGAATAIAQGLTLIGFNSHGFDVPYLVKRSWALEVPIPANIDIFSRWGMQPPWIDLMKQWQLGDRGADYVSLNTVAGFLGLGQKAGDCLQLRHQLEHEPATAIAYLTQDLVLTEQIALRMGF
jgi:hypothetical protein